MVYFIYLQLFLLVFIISVAYGLTETTNKEKHYCDEIKKEYLECMNLINIQEYTIDDFCTLAKSRKCRTFYSYKLNNIIKCNEFLFDDEAIAIELKVITNYAIEMLCARDYKYEYCPIGKLVFDHSFSVLYNESSENKQALQNHIYKTCNSYYCRLSFLEFKKELLKFSKAKGLFVEKAESISENFKYLESDECYSSIFNYFNYRGNYNYQTSSSKSSIHAKAYYLFPILVLLLIKFYYYG